MKAPGYHSTLTRSAFALGKAWEAALNPDIKTPNVFLSSHQVPLPVLAGLQ
jgi:hypothetical protein